MLDKAQVIMRDREAFLTLGWYRDNLIYAYNDKGELVSQWGIPHRGYSPSLRDVQGSMQAHISKGDYPLVPYEKGEK